MAIGDYAQVKATSIRLSAFAVIRHTRDSASAAMASLKWSGMPEVEITSIVAVSRDWPRTVQSMVEWPVLKRCAAGGQWRRSG
ncbi:hypothetical protein ACVILL_006595 [Bradyrhizobium sp. USDA 3364]